MHPKAEALHGFDWWNGPHKSLVTAQKVALKLALRGARQVSRYAWVSDRLPYCDDPVRVIWSKKPGAAGPPVEASMWAPCRRCPRCLQFRQMRLRERCAYEIGRTHNAGYRSWWVTLTFSPVHLAGVLAEAARAGDKSPAGVERAAYSHVQRYFKRLRKASKSRFRYFCVYERGEETGRSHYHVLMHEVGPKPLLKRTIEGQWRSQVHCRLVDVDRGRSGLSSYLTKYATKSVEVRPRLSLGYGKPDRNPVRGGNTSGRKVARH